MLKLEPASQGFYAKHNSGGGYTHYLRFYVDGTVIGATHSGTVEDVTTWLVPGLPRPGISVGKCQLAGNNLSFVMTSESGSVDYRGTASDDGSTLYLNFLSHINGNRGTDVLVYMPVPIEPSYRVPNLSSTDTLGSKGRFSIAGMGTGSMSIGPHIAFVGADLWPLINVRVSDGTRTAAVDFPIGLAEAMIERIPQIVAILRAPGLSSIDPFDPKGRFSVVGNVAGSMSISPLIALDLSRVINIEISDGAQPVRVDFPLGIADALVAEMHRIVAEYGDGNHPPTTWDTPWSSPRK